MSYNNWDELLHERHAWKEESVRRLEQKEDLFVTENPNLMGLSFKELTDFQAVKQSELNSNLKELENFSSMTVLPVLHYGLLPQKPIAGDREYLFQSDVVSFANLKDVYNYFLGYVGETAKLSARSHGFTSAHASKSINHISGQCSTCVQIIEAHCHENDIAKETQELAICLLPDLSGLIHLQSDAHHQIRKAYKQFRVLNLLLDNLLFSTNHHAHLNYELAKNELKKLQIREKVIARYQLNISEIRHFDLNLFNLLVESVDRAKQIVFFNMLKYQVFDREKMVRDFGEYLELMIRGLLLIGVGDDEKKYFNLGELLEDAHSSLSEVQSKHIQEHHDLYEHALSAGISGRLETLTCSYYQKYKKHT